MLGCSSRKCLFGTGRCSVASMACVSWCQNSPSWPRGNYESGNSSAAGVNRAAAPAAFMDNSTSMLNITAEEKLLVNLGGKGLEPQRTSVSSSFAEFVGGQVQTDPSCPAPASPKARLASTAHLEKAGTALRYPALGWAQDWAASRLGWASAMPAWSTGSRPLLSASTCPNRS